MKRFPNSVWISLVLLCLVLGPAIVANGKELLQQVPGDLLANGDFEGGSRNYDGIGELTVANNWYPSYVEDASRNIRRPEYKIEQGTSRVVQGKQGQKWFVTYGRMFGGIYQQVDVDCGDWLEGRCTFIVWSTNTDDLVSTAPDGKLAGLVGINPWGRTDAWHRTTVWGKESVDPATGLLAYDRQVNVSVVAQAFGSRVTFFAWGDAEFAVKHNDVYLDGCTLRKIAPPGEAITPTPAPTYTPYPTATPYPTYTPFPTPAVTPCPTCPAGGDCLTLEQLQAEIERWEFVIRPLPESVEGHR